jgi:phage baseplate assembly protein W
VPQIDIPQFAVPFRFENGQAVVVEQDSIDEVRGCVEILARIPLGSRLEHPDCGVSDPTFRTTDSVDDLREAIGDWEPRAEALIDSDLDLDTLTRNISIHVGVADA